MGQAWAATRAYERARARGAWKPATCSSCVLALWAMDVLRLKAAGSTGRHGPTDPCPSTRSCRDPPRPASPGRLTRPAGGWHAACGAHGGVPIGATCAHRTIARRNAQREASHGRTASWEASHHQSGSSAASTRARSSSASPSKRPKRFAQQRILHQQKQAAFLSINSSLLALGTAAGKFRLDKVFQAQLRRLPTRTCSPPPRPRAPAKEPTASRSIASSPRSVPSAAASSIATTPASRDPVLLRDRRRRDRRVHRTRRFQRRQRHQLRHHQHHRRAGNSATVDLHRGDRPGRARPHQRRAEHRRDRFRRRRAIIITDETGSTASNLIISNGFGYETATSLGIATAAGGVARTPSPAPTSAPSPRTRCRFSTTASACSARRLDRLPHLHPRRRTRHLHRPRRTHPRSGHRGRAEGQVYDPDTMPTGDDSSRPNSRSRARAATLGDVIEQINEQSDGKVRRSTPPTPASNSSTTPLTPAPLPHRRSARPTLDRQHRPRPGLGGLIGTGTTSRRFTGDRLLSGLNTVLSQPQRRAGSPRPT